MSDTQEVILNRMLDDISSDYDKSKGSFAYDILSGVAKELESKYKENEDEIANAHIDSATGKDLDERVKEYANIIRKNATYASGEVTIKADLNSTFQRGELVSIGSINYAADKDYAADSNGIIKANVICTILGAAGNTEANTIIYFPKTLKGLKTVTNEKAFTNGYNEETDEELRQRYYESVGDPETSGNISQYKSWAKSVIGVGDAKVLECWSGPGTIKIIIIDANKEVATAELCKEVKNYIESVRPACSGELTVESAEAVTIDVNLTITADTTLKTLDKIKEGIETTIDQYLKEISFETSTISYFLIAAKILACEGVKSVTELELNGVKEDISIHENEIAELGSVVYG